jgi:phosphatidylglycerol:prolipoprotein diacylglycerol transferase
MLPTFQIGPVSIQTPGIVIILSLWIGLSLAERQAPKHHINPDNLYNLVFITLISSIIGARLVYLARYPSAFSSHPLSLISLNPGLLDFWGGFGFGFVAAVIYAQRIRPSLWPILDSLTPIFALLAIGAGLAHLASGDAFGAPTHVPWGIELWGTTRQPSQLYESLAAVSIAFIVWPGSWLMRDKPAGSIFLSFIALSAGARLFLEAFRGDSLVFGNKLRGSQIIAWLILALSLWLLGKVRQPIGYTNAD